MTASTVLLRRCATRTHSAFTQRRWALVQDIRFFAVHTRLDERVYDKYRSKLERVAREKGFKDIDELKEGFSEQINKVKKESIVPDLNANHPVSCHPHTLENTRG